MSAAAAIARGIYREALRALGRPDDVDGDIIPLDQVSVVAVERLGVSASHRNFIYGCVDLAAWGDSQLEPVRRKSQTALGIDHGFVATCRREWSTGRLPMVDVTQIFLAPPDEFINCLTDLVTRFERQPQGVPPMPLAGLSAMAFMHPEDATAISALKALPGIDTLTKFIVNKTAKAQELRLLSSAIEVTKDSLPSLYSLFVGVCGTLDIKERPHLFIEPGGVGAYTIGADHPVVVLQQASLTFLTHSELTFVLGHELGHVKCGHQLYTTMARNIGTVARSLAGGLGALAADVTLAAGLNYWGRRAEFTGDRAGLLACQNIDAAIMALVKASGLPYGLTHEYRVRDAVVQAEKFERTLAESGFARASTALDSLDEDHPRTVWRIAELLRWKGTGDFADLVEATEPERQHLARVVGNDVMALTLVDASAAAISEWASPSGGTSRRQVLPDVRRMLRLGRASAEPVLEDVFAVDLTLRRVGANEFVASLRLLALVDGRPVTTTIELNEALAYDDLPEETRGAFLRTAEKSLTFALYRRTES